MAEYSLALFFNKLVSYTFMFWLPFYVKATRELERNDKTQCKLPPPLSSLDANLSAIQSDWLAILFDVGSLLGQSCYSKAF